MASRRVESRRLGVLLSSADAAGRESAGNSPRARRARAGNWLLARAGKDAARAGKDAARA
jgi:hypothetical protein